MISVKVPPWFERPVHPIVVWQFVDRTLSTMRVLGDSEWELPQDPNKLVVAATSEMAKT